MNVLREFSRRWWWGFALVLAGLASPTPQATVDPGLYSGLVWRNVGPFRGGRVSAVTGVIGQPGTFYAGFPLGGVWKTTSAGTTWYPIMDDVKEASSVGSVQVAPSDPNIIYVGMGDLVTGGGINEGNGVYKSTDAGKTWQHLGLDDTKQIPSILVDPKDPNLVLLAAQGNIHSLTTMRGVFRSTDGGKNWTKTLYVDSTTGAQEIAWAFDNPNVMLATTVRHYSAPGGGRGGGAGAAAAAPPAVPPVAGAPPVAPPGRGGRGAGGATGPTGTSLFKSTDEGRTWTEITGHGLPNLSGRTSIAVAMNTNSQRMFVIGSFGLYRSDDGGANWHQMAANDRRIANGQGGYNCGVYIDSKNPDIMYTLNTSSFKSVDGGNTFTGFKGAPGGDDPQQMWIDPTDGNRMLLGVDQGATVSLDGGKAWSSWYNQSTEQVYHISADNSYPYWIYATQQDAGAVATRSRGDLGAITPLDWRPVPGYEFGSIVADPLNPNIVYSGGPSGGIVRISYPSGQWFNVSPNVDASEALSKVGNQPLNWSVTNPHELLAGFQYLMSTIDGGMHWKKLSPNLGCPKGVTPPAPGAAGRGGRGRGGRGVPPAAATPPVAGAPPAGAPPAGGPPAAAAQAPAAGCGGNIESFSTSAVVPGMIWVGTSNGLIKLTRNHGLTWEDVTIPGLANPTRADISAIDASHQDAGAAYVAIDYHGVADFKPYLYRTADYGKTWTKIVNGLATDQPSGSFTRVIRADTKKAGLLFAGTESSMYVSFNNGDNWQSLMLNLPNTSYRDIVIKDNDLIVGTYGRGFFILDDYSPLRQITPEVASAPAYLFKPGDAIRVRRNVNGDTPFPPEVPHALNPPVGAIIYYHLSAKPSSDITLEVSDTTGKVIRHMSSAPFTPINEPLPPVPNFWLEVPKPMPTMVGTNRINWNLRYDNPPSASHSYEINANPGETPASPEGILAPPGIYRIKLTVDGKSQTQTVSVKNDPRSPAGALALKAQITMLVKLNDASSEASEGSRQVAAMRAAVAALTKPNTPAEVATAITAFDAKLAAIGGAAAGGRGGRGASAGNPGPEAAPPTFSALGGTMNRQLGFLDSGDMSPTGSMEHTWALSCNDMRRAVANWLSVNKGDLATFNALLQKNGLTPITAAAPALALPICPVLPPAAGAAPTTGRGAAAAAPTAGRGRGGGGG